MLGFALRPGRGGEQDTTPAGDSDEGHRTRCPATGGEDGRRPREGLHMASDREVAWWGKTRNLMITMLVIWAVFSFFIHFFVKALNAIVIFGFPLGFYMAAQGSLIVFVVMLFWFAGRQDAIDRDHGVAED